MPGIEPKEPDTPQAPPSPVIPLPAYRAALGRYENPLIAGIARTILPESPLTRARPTTIAGAIDERLSEPKFAERQIGALPIASRLALSLFALTDTTAWPWAGLAHALECLGVEPANAVRPLLDTGLVALEKVPAAVVTEFDRTLATALEEPTSLLVVAHPSAVSAARTVLPEGERPPVAGRVSLIREADGLEPILRMAAVWQRVAEAPLRQTQLGTFYKRDRERLEDDPVIAGPIADALEPLPDMPALWLSLARAVGLLQAEPGTERLTAAKPEYWAENAYHLPQMSATQWLGLRTWHEQGGMQQDGAEAMLALPFVRPAILLWLATVDETDWVTTEDLARLLRERSPRWDRPVFLDAPGMPASNLARGKSSKPSRPKGDADEGSGEASVLEAVLLGPAYQLGLVRAAEEASTRRRAVQLTPLGRYLLALGPPPLPRPQIEHFLFVQPNFEVIAYRQGLAPSLIGQFSRFAQWMQLSAALALRLTPDSVYRGLEGGLTPRAMLDHLARHSQRPLPAGVAESLRTWASRRDRVTYYAATTLIEFATPGDLEDARRVWPESDRPAPMRASDRLLLVEDESAIPFVRFRMTGARDYRRPPEVCVEVEPDGVTLTLDLVRSDLLVDAELARFADEQPAESVSARSGVSGYPRRRFVVTAESLGSSREIGVYDGAAFRVFRAENRPGSATGGSVARAGRGGTRGAALDLAADRFAHA